MAEDNRGPELVGTITVFLGLSAITVALRCYVRACMLKIFKIEDWLAVATMVFFALYCAISMVNVSNGAGKHMEDVPIENITKVLRLRWAGELTYIVTCLFLKFTVGIFLLRICSKAWQRSVIYMVLLVCFVYLIFYAFMTVFQCQPIPYFWHRFTGDMTGKCWSNELIEGATYTAAAITCISDWVLGLLPIALVRDLELTKRTKIMISFTLALGSLASTATIVRIPYVRKLTLSGDFMYEFTDLVIWSAAENGLGLIAASIATLRPLVRAFFGGTRVGTPSHQRRSIYSWRRSDVVEIRRRAQSENIQYFRMGDYNIKSPEPIRKHIRNASDFR